MCNAWCVDFVKDSLEFWEDSPRVLEVGARDVNGSTRTVYERLAKSYIGIDIEAGKGVNALVDVHHLAEHFEPGSFDIVLSTELLEHIEDWPNALCQMMSVLKHEGLLILTTRSMGFEIHGHPNDYWRFSGNDMSLIFKGVGDILLMADDMTQGYPCGIGVVVKKTGTASRLEDWRAHLRSSFKLYNVHTSNRITVQGYDSLNAVHDGSSPIERSSDVLELPFDQYHRYRIIQETIDLLRWKKPLRILDVGGSPATLTRFLPQDQVIVADRSDQGGLHVFADGLSLPFRNAEFDVVTSSDVLEHVIPSDRTHFLTELTRVSSEVVILGAPFDDPAVNQAEEVFQELIWARYGKGYHFIEEHRRNGLPPLQETGQFLKDHGFQVTVLFNGYVHRWLVALSTFFLLQWRFHDPKLNARVNAYYNQNFYRADNREPSYRKVLVAARSRDVSGIRPQICPEPQAPESDKLFHLQILGLLMQLLTEGWSTRALASEEELSKEQKAVQELVAQVGEKEQEVHRLTTELSARMAEKEHEVHVLSARLASREDELQRIHRSLGWRILSRYGKFKYRYVLPLLRLMHLGPQEPQVGLETGGEQDRATHTRSSE